MIEQAELDKRFAYHTNRTTETGKRHETIRRECRTLAIVINNFVPDGREKSTALSRLEEVMMWATAGIARNQEDAPSPDPS